ncbi:MAG: hypothetical protein UZ21_OP11001000701 [Microgenomates bacterium OLB22]|nr:MAG: hypothetical protein UZ21_OP11001000701 [Microgenomates bacterium OLB22]
MTLVKVFKFDTYAPSDQVQSEIQSWFDRVYAWQKLHQLRIVDSKAVIESGYVFDFLVFTLQDNAGNYQQAS